ncbi:hypothetical protein AAVH_31339, partial [Aphelenchoides avenae]
MAPEVAKLYCGLSNMPVSQSADEWAFLIFAIELMNGYAPYESSSNEAVLRAICSSPDYAADFKRVFLFRREQFPNLCQLVDDHLQSDPASSWPTAQIVQDYCFIQEATADVLDGPIQNSH